MRYLVVAPQLGFTSSGSLIAGGLQQFGRCLVRAVASSPTVKKLGIWSQVESEDVQPFIRNMVRVYAHNQLELDIRGFGGSRTKLMMAIVATNLQQAYDHIVYLLVNQAVLTLLPFHRPYTVWEIGRELFEPVSWCKYQALSKANRILSISEHTAYTAKQKNPGLPQSQVVHLCIEPPLLAPESEDEIEKPYEPGARELAVLIVGSMFRNLLYKGQRELIAAWPEVIESCPKAELWIVGGGDGRIELEAQVQRLPTTVAKQIRFLGRLDTADLQDRYRRCRVFAMPSTSEGFGLVFIEAAKFGVPGIGGKHDSVREVVLDNKTGLLVEQTPHEVAIACLRLLNDDELARRLGEGARQRYLQHFRFHHFQKRLLQALELEQS
jgi:phosphatidyl-myo-inositol dimannoside synthase